MIVISTSHVDHDFKQYINLFSGYCLYLIRRISKVHSYDCSHFIDGCHKSPYRSNEIFKCKKFYSYEYNYLRIVNTIHTNWNVQCFIRWYDIDGKKKTRKNPNNIKMGKYLKLKKKIFLLTILLSYI